MLDARERRTIPRVETTLRAKAFPSAADCVVADFNERGARLRFEQGAPPAGGRLIVVIWTTGLAFEGQVCWRTGSDIGLRFIRRCDFRSRVPSDFWAARSAWLRSRPKLKRRMLKAATFTVTPRAIGWADRGRVASSALAGMRRQPEL